MHMNLRTAWRMALVTVISGILRTSTLAAEPYSTNSELFMGWVTNGPAVFQVYSNPPPSGFFTNSVGKVMRRPVSRLPRAPIQVFDHYFPDSLNYLLWTNFIAHTNGRTTQIWSVRDHPPGWPTNAAPVVVWNTNCLMWGMKGLTALSPCWQSEGSSGQVPITLLTRRHGYTRGHSMGAPGFGKSFAGYRVWFVTTNNTVIEVKAARGVVRPRSTGDHDYTILLFDRDLPASIEPIRVVLPAALRTHYPQPRSAPCPMFCTEQTGNLSAEVPGWQVNVGKGGDSGSPVMLPMPHELVFCTGMATTGPSKEMQSDMDELCRQEGLSPKRYRMKWVDLTSFPTY